MHKIVVLLAVATIGLGTLCALQWRRHAEHKALANRLQVELEEKSKLIADLQAAKERADLDRTELRAVTDELSNKVRAQQAAASENGTPAKAISASVAAEGTNSGASGLGGAFGKMMSDPETREFIRNQQRLMMDSLYKPVIRKMGLSPEEAARFKDLLADNMMKGAEKAGTLLGSTNRAELASTIAAEQKNFDEQLKAFLGDERYSIYKDYQETVGERAQLNMFRQQNEGETALNDQQFEQLLTIMKEEKQNVTATLGQPMSGLDQNPANFEAMFSEEGAQKLLGSQEALNERVFERARAVLSPDQLQAFSDYQTNQLQMMRMGITMARRMMATESAPPPGPPAAPVPER